METWRLQHGHYLQFHRKTVFTDHITESIVLDEQHLSEAEDHGFHQVLVHLEPRHTFSRHCYFADIFIAALYDVVAPQVYSPSEV